MWQARPSGVGKRGHPGQELERAGLPLLHKSPQRSSKNADSDSEGLGWGPKFCIFTNSQVTCCCCSGDQFRRFCGPTKGMEEWMWVRVGRERRARNIRAGLGGGGALLWLRRGHAWEMAARGSRQKAPLK